jgi:hypothetical protein
MNARRRRGMGPAADPLACPSAPPEWEGAKLIGVVEGSAREPQVRFVTPRPVTPELLALAEPVTPTEVFRFTAPCKEGACSQWREGRCGVAVATLAHVAPAEAMALPACAIRSECRWWHDAGADACRRCRFVVTDDAARPADYAAALAEDPANLR